MNALIASCHYLGRALQAPPDVPFLDQSRTAFANIPALARIIDLTRHTDLPELAREAAEDHLRLFSGPAPLAPPWESVWTEKDRLLFGECTAEVAGIYQNWGIAICGEGHAPHDHLGLELTFMGWLLENEEQISQRGTRARDAAILFLHGHILRFAPQVLTTARKSALTPYYQLVCETANSILATLGHKLPPVHS